MKRLLKLALALWLLRWAAQELVAYSGRHWQRPGPPPRDSERPPGWMPARVGGQALHDADMQ